MPPLHKRLMPTEDVLEILDQTVTSLSQCAVEVAGMITDGDEVRCLPQWEALEKAARALQQAREIDNETLSAISLISAQKNIIKRAVALMDCLKSGSQDGSADKSKRTWGRVNDDDWPDEET